MTPDDTILFFSSPNFLLPSLLFLVLSQSIDNCSSQYNYYNITILKYGQITAASSNSEALRTGHREYGRAINHLFQIISVSNYDKRLTVERLIYV